jgi:hypothetical protein
MNWKQRRTRRKQVTSAADAIAGLLEGYHVAEEVRARRLVTEWPAVVGSRFAARTWPEDVRDRVLWVRVSNHSWMQELSFAKAKLIERIHELTGDPPLIDDVRFHLGGKRKDDLTDVRAAIRQRRPIRRRRPLPAPATGPRLAQIERECQAVEDPELREVIAEARRLLDR